MRRGAVLIPAVLLIAAVNDLTVLTLIREVEQRKREIRAYIRSLRETTAAVFSESLWRALVQKVIVYARKRMVFRMMDGSEIICRVKE